MEITIKSWSTNVINEIGFIFNCDILSLIQKRKHKVVMEIEVTMTSSLLLLDYQKYLTSNGIVHGPISDVLLDETPKNV